MIWGFMVFQADQVIRIEFNGLNVYGFAETLTLRHKEETGMMGLHLCVFDAGLIYVAE